MSLPGDQGAPAIGESTPSHQSIKKAIERLPESALPDVLLYVCTAMHKKGVLKKFDIPSLVKSHLDRLQGK